MRNLLLVGALVLVGFLLVRGSSAQSGIVRAVDAWALIRSGALLLDVRTPEEFQQGHLEGAINIPYDEIHRRLAELGDSSKRIVAYCRSGNRSGKAKGILEGLGYNNVVNAGGFQALVASR